ncbi:MAG: protein kinase [Methylococcaceae bacterium]|nr:protein kinase [Methylococcaceae bacterium]MCI0732248.1 protein kinase [Methylococcaceae bacterium]
MQKSINALPTGFRISSYEIVEELGSGGFGITYKAYDSHLQTHVAIKEYLPVSFAVRESDTIHVAPRSNAVARDYKYGLDMFLQEARTLARFRNDRIVRVIQFMEANNTAYLVMEYENGASLAAKIQDHSYPTAESQVLNLLVQTLQGLAIVHRASILHRDIKPSNIYIRQDNSPVLLDFGSARYALSEHTMSLTSIVSPGYAPFEQYFSDGKQGPWTDFYALGATLYWVVTGKRPAEATERIIAVTGNQPDPNIPASQFARDRYNPPLLECIDWMLEPKVENRPQTADSIVERIQDRSRPTSRLVSSPATKAETLPVARPIAASRVLLAGLAFGLLAVIVLLFNQKPESTEISAVQPSASPPESAKPPVPASMVPGLAAVTMPEQPADSATGIADAPQNTTPSFRYDPESPIDELLKAGDRALLERRLTTPADDSAVYYYRKALELSPENPQAEAGLKRVVSTYIALADQESRHGDPVAARRYLERASSIDPGNPEILAARNLIAASRPASRTQTVSKPRTTRSAPESGITQALPISRTTLDPTAKYRNVRSAKIGYSNGDITKAEYARIRDILASRYRRRISELKQQYREGKLTKYEYKQRAREAEIDYKG